MLDAAQEMYSDEFLRDPSNDFAKQLADIRKPYMHLMTDIGTNHQGCTPYCGTDRNSYAISMYSDVVEGILRLMENQQQNKPPRVENPEYREWIRRGRPFWPPQ